MRVRTIVEDRVVQEADDLSGQVLLRALLASGFRCKGCTFLENVENFQKLLAEYIFCKKKLHQYERREGSDRFYMRKPLFSRDKFDNYFYRMRSVRRDLEVIWPCANCLMRFNPCGNLKVADRFLRVQKGIGVECLM